MTEPTPKTWTTEHECQFIDGLGGHGNRLKPGAEQRQLDRAELLDQYLAALKLRKAWIGSGLDLDHRKIREYAAKALREVKK